MDYSQNPWFKPLFEGTMVTYKPDPIRHIFTPDDSALTTYHCGIARLDAMRAISIGGALNVVMPTPQTLVFTAPHPYALTLPTILHFSKNDSAFTIKHKLVSYFKTNKKTVPSAKELNKLFQQAFTHKKVML